MTLFINTIATSMPDRCSWPAYWSFAQYLMPAPAVVFGRLGTHFNLSSGGHFIALAAKTLALLKSPLSTTSFRLF